MLPDYSFYTQQYHGNRIPEEEFPRLITRAGAYLARFPGVDKESEAYKKAACAVAEAWQTNEQGGDIASQTVGSWSRSFAQKKPKSDEQRLLEAAQIYLGGAVSPVRWV